MKKSLKLIATLLIIALTVAGYIFLTNRQYIAEGSMSVSIDDSKINYQNWDTTKDGALISLDDPQILLPEIGEHVINVSLTVQIDPDYISPKIYYTQSADQIFDEKLAIIPEYSYDGNTLVLDLGLDIYNLRIDLTDESGVEARFEQIAYTQNLEFTINILHCMMWVFIVLIIVSPIFLPKNWVGELSGSIASFKKYRHLLYNLVNRDIITKYRRSVLGIAWSVLNPLLMMIIITAVFQELFKVEMENFPLYYLTGSLIFNYVNESTTLSTTSILEASSLIRKVYIPKYIFPVEKCLSSFVNMLFSLVAIFIMFVVLHFRPHLTIFLMFIPMIYVVIFSIGLSLILSTANVFFRDVLHLYSVWTTAWMYLTPIIYSLDGMRAEIVAIIKFNPLYYYVDYFRQLVLYGTIPGLEHNLICLFFSFLFLTLGILVFKRNQDKFILYI